MPYKLRVKFNEMRKALIFLPGDHFIPPPVSGYVVKPIMYSPVVLRTEHVKVQDAVAVPALAAHNARTHLVVACSTTNLGFDRVSSVTRAPIGNVTMGFRVWPELSPLTAGPLKLRK